MHQLNATQGAGARDKGAQECDQLKDEREHELQDTHVGFEATEVTYSHILKKNRNIRPQINRTLKTLDR